MIYSGPMTPIIRTSLKITVLAATLLTSFGGGVPAFAEVEVGRGGSPGACFTLVSVLKSRWSDVKNHMLPPTGQIRHPKTEDFMCLPPKVIRSSLEKRIGTGANIKCFSRPDSKGVGICCDSAVSTCAQLNPGLFPELARRRNKEANRPPKSNWVKPPSDSDQWGTN